MNHFQPHMMPQPNQQPTPRSTTAHGIHPRFPPSNQLQTPMQQTSVPQPNTFNQNEQRPWRQGKYFQINFLGLIMVPGSLTFLKMNKRSSCIRWSSQWN